MPIYVFDPVGNLSDNLVTNESAQVLSVNGVDHNYIIPVFAPFYGNSLVVVDQTNGEILDPGVDYELTHEFREMSTHVNSGIYGSFTFTDSNRSGFFRIRYQTLGGDFVDTTTQALSDGLALLADLRTIDWSDIVGVPTVFPPSPHTQPVTDIESVTQLIAAIQSATTAISAGSREIHMNDIIDLDSTYITPLFTNLQNIATEIRNKNLTNNIYHEQTSPGITRTDAGNYLAGQWSDLPLQVKPATGISGTFEIKYDLKAVTVPANTDYDVRFVVNGLVVSKSYINGAYVGLDDTMTVKLQIKPRTTNISEFVIADVNYTSSLSIERKSN